jgi:aryl sulfotransferase
MKNIIWLASYPKSGNTWLRVFLTNLLQDNDEPADINRLERTPIASARGIFDEAVGIEAADLTHEEVERLRPEVYEHISNRANGTRFLKIHDAYTYIDDCPGKPLVSLNATRGAIYIIRSPLDVAVSFANHSAISIDKAVERMANEKTCFSNVPGRLNNQLRQRLLSWSGHVLSWVGAPGLELHVMRYEDMHCSAEAAFMDAIRFAGLEFSPDRVEKALAFSDISEMQRQEKEKGFREKPAHCRAFFRKGKPGDWRDLLHPGQVKKIIADHGEVMKRFGYLDQKGEPVF